MINLTSIKVFMNITRSRIAIASKMKLQFFKFSTYISDSGDRANPVGLGFSGRGEVVHASRLFPKLPKPLTLPGSKVREKLNQLY